MTVESRMRRILMNQDLDKDFARDGYLKIPFLDPGEAAELRALIVALNADCSKRPANVSAEYSLSFFSAEPALKRRVFDEITSFLMPKVDRIVDGYVPLIANIFNKK